MNYDIFVVKDYIHSRPLLLFSRYEGNKIIQFATWLDEDPDWTPIKMLKNQEIKFDNNQDGLGAFDFYELAKTNPREDILFLGTVNISINDLLESRTLAL
jgi:hypothetical protein